MKITQKSDNKGRYTMDKLVMDNIYFWVIAIMLVALVFLLDVIYSSSAADLVQNVLVLYTLIYIRYMYSKVINNFIDKSTHLSILEDTEKEVTRLAYEECIKEYSFSIQDIITLYPAVLVLKKYNISAYYITNKPLCVHVNIPMSVYTKMSIQKDINDIIKYHITGTDIVL